MTSVATITANVRKTMSSRSGKSIGSASAATSETAPRMPTHEITAGHCHGGYGSCSRTERNAQRGRYVKIGTHTMRVTITVAQTRAA